MLDETTLPRRRRADRRAQLTREVFIQEYALPGTPVVLEGAAADWPAMHKWDRNFFLRHYGELEVTVVRTRDKRDRKQMRLAAFMDYMQHVSDANPYYLASWVFGKACPALLADYCNPPHFDRWEKQLPVHLQPEWQWIFMGPRGSGSPLHVDTLYSSAWNAVITGRKRWLFYHPRQTAYLYQGRVDAFHPDYEAYPRFSNAEAIECIQYAGDLVYTPSGWWHQVYNEEAGVSITENFINASNYESVVLAIQMADLPELLEAVRTHLPVPR